MHLVSVDLESGKQISNVEVNNDLDNDWQLSTEHNQDISRQRSTNFQASMDQGRNVNTDANDQGPGITLAAKQNLNTKAESSEDSNGQVTDPEAEQFDIDFAILDSQDMVEVNIGEKVDLNGRLSQNLAQVVNERLDVANITMFRLEIKQFLNRDIDVGIQLDQKSWERKKTGSGLSTCGTSLGGDGVVRATSQWRSRGKDGEGHNGDREDLGEGQHVKRM